MNAPVSPPSIAHLHAAFARAEDSPTALVERNIAAVDDPAGEGSRTFLSLNRDSVRAAALVSGARVSTGSRPLEGITISIKDLFDVAGEVTSAGSTVLRPRAPATIDAPTVARLRAAGANIFGRTNMVEFAFSGVGINPHYGTPRAVWGRTADGDGRVPGGSSSGAAVSVTDGKCVAALGTDTGGSVRIPAAFNGLVGFKPTAQRVPVLGAVPLSTSCDSIGPLATTVACCAQIDSVLAGEPHAPLPPVDLRGVKLLMPLGALWQDLDSEVEFATHDAVAALRRSGAQIVAAPLPLIDEFFAAKLAIVAPEALDWHTENVNVGGVGYDPRVWQRMQLGRDVTRAQYTAALAFRRFWIDRMHLAMADFDAIVCPTSPCLPPKIAPLTGDTDLFFVANARVLRNAWWVNMMDGCALTLPCHTAGDAPVGLQLVGRHGTDRALLALGAACEAELSKGPV